MSLDTLKDVTYKYQAYVVGHDGLVNTDDLYARLKDVADKLGIKNSWSNDGTTFSLFNGGDQAIESRFYLNGDAEKYRVETRVIIGLEEYDKDHIIEGNKNIYFYKPTDKVKVYIKAGSKSAFDSSDKLTASQKFNVDDVAGIKKFIEDENARIIGNVDPNADPNRSSKEFSEALQNSMYYNN
jgi:hypothetical protein